jgi:hypothetical protein
MNYLIWGKKSIAAQYAEAEIQKSQALQKQKKLLQKPGFNVLMGRYNSLPSKPRAISKSKLAQLADPILGRLTNADKGKFQSILKRKGGMGHIESDDPRVKKIVLSINEEEGDVRLSRMQYPKPKANVEGGFFMTEAAIDEDDSYEKGYSSPGRQKGTISRIQSNISSSKNGFASMIRNRVQDAKKMNKLVKPIELYRGRSDDLDETAKRAELTNAYKKRLDKLKKANKDIHERNKTMLKRMKDKRSNLGLDSSMSESSQTGKVRKVGVIKDPKTGRIKKVNSSGYGKLVQRFSNQPKPRNPTRQKLVDNNKESSVEGTDGSFSDITPGPTPKLVANNKKSLSKVTSLRAIEEHPDDVPKPLSKKLSSSSAPHLNRSKSKSKLQTASKPGCESAAVPVDSNNQKDSKKRIIRSAGAVRIATNDLETEMLMKIVDAKRQTGIPIVPSTKESSEIVPTTSLSPGKSNFRLEPIVENSIPKFTLPAHHTVSASSPLKHVLLSPTPPTVVDADQKRVMETNIQDLLQRDQNKITEDIAASIQKLQQFEKSVVSGDMYCKPDVNSTMARRAEKLGGHLSAAESILAEYEMLRDF